MNYSEDNYSDAATKADEKEITPLAQAQMRESELILQLSMALGRLHDRLKPVLSESSQTIGGDEPLSKEATTLRMGSSPTINMIEQQCENLESSTTIINRLMRDLEV